MALDFSKEGDRYKGSDGITEIFRPWFAARRFEQVASELDNAGACWGKYQSIREVIEKDIDCSVDNPLFQMVDQPGIGEYLMPDHPLRFTGMEQEAVRPAPRLGQHTEEILADTLGLSSGEIAKLFDQKIVAGSDQQ
eukprot:TRINITY_DN6638_c0_g2_i1.p3 TRINITY_DN6638_c0_g2~~TRINITY_DN6638_c0_g2_i1.p3  ORF type:complete len:137 (+),score=23.78 TRINITY_DN6638_c0_g2_i1:70-480(+)